MWLKSTQPRSNDGTARNFDSQEPKEKPKDTGGKMFENPMGVFWEPTSTLGPDSLQGVEALGPGVFRRRLS